MSGQHRRSTDQLELTDAQQAFLDQISLNLTDAVAAALKTHEESSHPTREEVMEVVKVTLAAGDYLLPNGQTPREMIKRHSDMEAGQKSLDKNMGSLLDVVVGPVIVQWNGEPDPDGMRDETQGMKARTDASFSVAEKMDSYLSNGGVPVKLQASVKAAIWGASATVIAAVITSTALLADVILR